MRGREAGRGKRWKWSHRAWKGRKKGGGEEEAGGGGGWRGEGRGGRGEVLLKRDSQCLIKLGFSFNERFKDELLVPGVNKNWN